ncbi:MAG: glycosyltransferase family 4 protein [Coriobacteriia bacterium]|nr:glycosyltransferase family 4 protein [Coriobacteriia bacterium]
MAECRVAYLTLQATTEGQGAHTHVHGIIEGLERLGWAVDLFEPGYSGGAAPGAPGRLAEFARVQRRLIRCLRTGHYDALYIRGHALAWLAARAARRLGVPVIQECNGPYTDFYAMWPRARLAKPVIEYMARSQFARATARIAVTPELASWLEAETGSPAAIIGNGADTGLFTPEARSSHSATLPERYAVFFGALSPWQGIDLLLDAAEHEDWPNGVALIMVGDGVLRPKVDRAATTSTRVVAAGVVPYHEVPGIVSGSIASMVLSHRPAEWGLSPLKLYESMACGTPVVVADVPGTSTVVREHGCGVVVPLDDSAGVARAVGYIASHPEAAGEMGVRGREASERHYSWRARAEATSEVIEDAIRTRRGDPPCAGR